MIAKTTTLHALKWSTMGNILPQFVGPFISIYIARLLAPEAYGLIAIATIVITFLRLFQSHGFTTALIQYKGNRKKISSIADFIFSFNLVISTLLYLIILFSSGFIASFFHNHDSKLVVCILSISLVIHAFSDVQLAMLQKQMDFKSIFYRQIVPISSQLIVTLPLASMGLGVWALVGGKLTSDIAGAVVLWRKSEWKPRLNFSFKENIKIIKFGLYVLGTSLMAWVLIQGDNLIVGKFLSTKELGLYKTGYDFDSRIFGIFVIPILPVFYSKFCSLKTNQDIKEYYLKLKEYISIIIFPMIFGIILVSPYFENLILGEKWKGISFIMALLTMTGASNLWALMDGLFKSLGKPEVCIKITIIVVCIDIPLWLFFVQYGLKTFVIARILIDCIALGINTYFENKELRINLLQALRYYYKAFFASIGMLIIGICIQKFIFTNNYKLIYLILLISISIITYSFLIWIFSQEKIQALKELFIREFFTKKGRITI